MKRILIVDGYNVLNARRSMSDSTALAEARDKLRARLQNYAGYSGQQIILVFDAWLTNRLQRTEEQYGSVSVVYTRKGETADHYIERLCEKYADQIDARKIEVRVATSDNLEQTIVLGRGATRISSRELLYEMEQVCTTGARQVTDPLSKHNPLFDRLPESVRAKLDEMIRNNS